MSPLLDQRDPALEARLSEALRGLKWSGPVYAFQQVESTMDLAHELAAAGSPEGTVVWALEQTGGRGRRGRAWASPEGGLYASVILRPGATPGRTPQLALVAGLAAVEAIQSLTGLVPCIRWPNDVLLNGCKVGGTLVEARDGAVVVGQGINVRAPAETLLEVATSLAACGAPETDIVRLLAAWCRQLERWYGRWRQDGFEPIRGALRPRMALFGDMVHLQLGEHRVEGVAADLDEAGRLLVRLESGLLRGFDMGQVLRLE